jgi:hypothetical protein
MEEGKDSAEAAITNGRATRPQSRPWAWHFRSRSHLVLIALCLLIWILFFPRGYTIQFSLISTPNNDQSSIFTTQKFQWNDIKPSQSLQYSPCYEHFQCARLSMPLNWNSTTAERESNPRFAIALIKLPAKVPVTHPQYGGPVIFNPGGPGESGISQVLVDGKNLQIILDSPVPPADEKSISASGKYFDILSFDPRGVNNTSPGLQCFSDAVNQEAWRLTYPDYGLLWNSEGIVGMEMARAAALGASCSQKTGEVDVLPYINTAQGVGDIVEIIEREGDWREKEAQRLTALGRYKESPLTHKGVCMSSAPLSGRLVNNDHYKAEWFHQSCSEGLAIAL